MEGPAQIGPLDLGTHPLIPAEATAATWSSRKQAPQQRGLRQTPLARLPPCLPLSPSRSEGQGGDGREDRSLSWELKGFGERKWLGSGGAGGIGLLLLSSPSKENPTRHPRAEALASPREAASWGDVSSASRSWGLSVHLCSRAEFLVQALLLPAGSPCSFPGHRPGMGRDFPRGR